jgi:hypothetical protein
MLHAMQLDDAVTVSVSAIDGRKATLVFKRNATIALVKWQVSQALDIPVPSQRLFFGGREEALHDAGTVGGLSAGSAELVLFVVVQPVSGFSDICFGKNIKLKPMAGDESICLVAERKGAGSGWDYGCVMSANPIPFFPGYGHVFEIKVTGVLLDWSGGMGVGVTVQHPAAIAAAGYTDHQEMMSWKADDAWLFGFAGAYSGMIVSGERHQGNTGFEYPGSVWPRNGPEQGDLVTVVIDTEFSMHILLNGADIGACFPTIPEAGSFFAVVDVVATCSEVEWQTCPMYKEAARAETDKTKPAH